MTGLRQRQKVDRERRILEAAAELFKREGYDGAKMEAIAEHAGVSAGTIYNYHQNKGDLLVAIVAMEVNEVLAAGERLVERPPANACAAVDGLFRIYLEHSLTYLSKEMWRHAMAISLQQPESPSGSAYSKLDEKLSGQVCRLIARLQVAGLVRSDVDSVAIGELLFNTMDRTFMTFLKSEGAKLSTLRRRLSMQSHSLLDVVGGMAGRPRRPRTTNAAAKARTSVKTSVRRSTNQISET